MSISVGVVFLSVLAILPLVVYWFFTYKFSYWRKRGVVHETPQIPYGHLAGIGISEDINERVSKLYVKYKHTSPLVGMYFITVPMAVVTDLDVINAIMVKDFNHFADRGLFFNERVDPLSGHLFFLEGKRWKELRTKLTPTFTTSRMKFMFTAVLEVANKFGELLVEEAGKNPILEIRELLARFTTDVIGSIAFGIDCNSLTDDDAEFRKCGKAIFSKPRGTHLSRLVTIAYRDIARKLGMKLLNDQVSSFFIKVVEDNVKYREQDNVRRNDFMDLLIQLKNHGRLDADNESFVGKLQFDELAAQAFVFFAAGFETSSSTMAFCLYELAQNQEIQAKLRKEIESVLVRHNGTLTYEALAEIKYLEQVINETLRKYPSVPLLHRNTTESYQVPGTKYVLEKGVRVIIPVYAIHHDPDIYPDPEKFDPDRFCSDTIKQRKTSAFLPFGTGPRNCIGLRFGRMQVSIGLITILRCFNVDVTPDLPNPLKLKLLSIVNQVESDINLKLTKIHS